MLSRLASPFPAAGATDNVPDASNLRAHDPDAAAARRFWLPDDAWSTVGEFLSREDVLRLRTTDRDMRAVMDPSIPSLTLSSACLAAFIGSAGFQSVTTLRVGSLDGAELRALIAHLAAHPRPGMTLRFDGARMEWDAATLAELSALRLGGLALRLRSAVSDELAALVPCGYPIDLEMRDATREALGAAANLPTLRRLTSSAVGMDEHLAQRFATRGVLEALALRIDARVSPRTLQTLAAIPSLRECYLNARNAPDIDVATARAFAANACLENLTIVSNGAGLDEDGFAALSRSRSLTTLRVPLRTGMLSLADMTSVSTLVFGGRGTFPYAMLDVATARSIAALPALDSIAFPIMNREAGALTPILKDGTARRLAFSWVTAWGNDDFLRPDERAALAANQRLQALSFHQGDLHGPDLDVVLRHPTIEYVKSGGTEYRRRPDGQAAPTWLRA